MARIVCGIPFRTKRGTTAAREIRRLLVAACVVAVLWGAHSFLYLSYLSVVPCAYIVGVAFALATCCAGAQARNPRALYAFHVGMACAAAILALAFAAVFIAFIVLGAAQYTVQGSGDWSLNLTSVQKNSPCTDRLPLNNSHHTGPPDILRPTNPIPLGCDFYYNMRGQQITVFLVVACFASFLSCMLCVQGFQMFEVVAGPQKDPNYENMDTARGRLESLLNEEVDIEEAAFLESRGDDAFGGAAGVGGGASKVRYNVHGVVNGGSSV
jgi:RsiW-degrading membrane proteinase PrsW (M82 family)